MSGVSHKEGLIVLACVLQMAVGCAPLATGAGSPPRNLSHDRVRSDSSEQDRIRRVALNYVEGFYEGDSAKLGRAFTPSMYKLGMWRRAGSDGFAERQMSLVQAHDYARRVRQGEIRTPDGAPLSVEIFDTQSVTASGKVTAYWGTDYLLFVHQGGAWRIAEVLWQSYPRTDSTP